jgi:diadenosine tetraphosphate (Ap4A) HIT family hydrolase
LSRRKNPNLNNSARKCAQFENTFLLGVEIKYFVEEKKAMFSLHPRLEQDTFKVTDFALSRLLLMNNRNFPWLILVPRKQDIREITDLDHKDRLVLMEEICLVSDKMQTLFRPDKINVASLGNLVPQLHIHVVARYLDDTAWPGPVWGASCVPYEGQAIKEILVKLGTNIAIVG